LSSFYLFHGTNWIKFCCNLFHSREFFGNNGWGSNIISRQSYSAILISSDKVSSEENDMLDAPFTEEEIKSAIFTLIVRALRTGWLYFLILSKVLGSNKGRFDQSL
jgi:hypothetical protein